MITFISETNFKIKSIKKTRKFIKSVIEKEKKNPGKISFVFCNDSFLHKLNLTYLKHDNLTDILTFDYSNTHTISGDIFISIDRVKENSVLFENTFYEELHRVMVHGILHLLGYKDQNKKQKLLIREKENFYLSLQT